jgi:hypothetical protein
MARPFDIGGPATALRIYLILICCAARGETVTYEDLRGHGGEMAQLPESSDDRVILGLLVTAICTLTVVLSRKWNCPAPC